MKKFSLTIPEPCHENWDKMTKEDKGRFCSSCQKTVIDFTNMSDREIAEFFKRPPSSLCGHFQKDQLDRDILVPRKRIPWIKYFFQFGLPAFLVSMKASAQGQVRLTGDTVMTAQDPLSSKTSQTTPETFEGKVVDRNGHPLTGVSITVIETRENTLSDINGKFVLHTKGKEPGLLFSAVGFQTKLVKKASPGSNVILEEWVSGNVLLLGKVRTCTPEKEKKKLKKNEQKTVQPVKSPIEKVQMEGAALSETSSMQIEKPIGIKFEGKPAINIDYKLQEMLDGEVQVVEQAPKLKTERFIDTIARILSFGTGHVPSFSVYPSPASAGLPITISFKKFETGNYILSVISNSGGVIQAKKLTISNKTGSIENVLPASAAGTYFIRLTNKKSGKSFTEKIIVQ